MSHSQHDTLHHQIRVCMAVATRSGYFLVDEEDSVPSRFLRVGEQSRQVAEELLLEATGLKHGEWVVVRQVEFIDTEEGKPHAVLYAAELPDHFPLLPSYHWLSFRDVVHHPGVARMYTQAYNAITL